MKKRLTKKELETELKKEKKRTAILKKTLRDISANNKLLVLRLNKIINSFNEVKAQRIRVIKWSRNKRNNLRDYENE